MPYIRKREEELTCIQESAPLQNETDFGTDFVCVYGVSGDMVERIKKFRDRGYVIHLMTGIAWGGYDDYFNGDWDGRDHRDETQKSRDGSMTGGDIHSSGYIVPTISYTNYLIEKLKLAVDAGVEAIHVEEPEFLNAGGYSDAFKREYKLYYHEDWTPPHESVDAHYKAAKLKAYLYRRAIERVSQELREYALVNYGRVLRFYVPTHSLLNYSQWKVMSPEGTMTDIPSLDGYKAQIWMGTSREANVYNGVYKERTFETAFLEYGIMQELVRDTGRTMWFDNDPIEDRPCYTWDSYRVNYKKTLIGSLLQPRINRFQVSPWPRRVFCRDAVYPKDDPNAVPIPEDYRTQLLNIFQMLGTFGTEDHEYKNKTPDVGVFLSDTAMFQRNFSDDVMAKKDEYPPVGKIDIRSTSNYYVGLEQVLKNGNRLDFYESLAFPLFYGMALPLLKGGLPVRPVQLENIIRYPSYLDNYKLLVLSYEFMKPQNAEVNMSLANYVLDGGTLVYVGDGTDPFHNIRSWWNSGKNNFKTPLEHLLSVMKIPDDAPDGEYSYGKGKFVLIRKSPADFCVDKDLASSYREKISELIGTRLDKNYISLRRGEYIITAVMDECESDEPFVHTGRFVDMLDPTLPVISEKTVYPDDFAVLYDLDFIKDKSAEIIGTSIRAEEFDVDENGFVFKGRGAYCNANIRLKLPERPEKASGKITLADAEETKDIDVDLTWDEDTGTALLSFKNTAGLTEIRGEFIKR
ncbi:MAG: hypothetical protein K6F09_03010 [Clostridiales bacterium]|nr:hypothetical protein [Clostridiales bacterium]